jgi:hypothetical protein
VHLRFDVLPWRIGSLFAICLIAAMASSAVMSASANVVANVFELVED